MLKDICSKYSEIPEYVFVSSYGDYGSHFPFGELQKFHAMDVWLSGTVNTRDQDLPNLGTCYYVSPLAPPIYVKNSLVVPKYLVALLEKFGCECEPISSVCPRNFDVSMAPRSGSKNTPSLPDNPKLFWPEPRSYDFGHYYVVPNQNLQKILRDVDLPIVGSCHEQLRVGWEALIKFQVDRPVVGWALGFFFRQDLYEVIKPLLPSSYFVAFHGISEIPKKHIRLKF